MNIYISCIKEEKNPVIQIPSQSNGLNFLFFFFFFFLLPFGYDWMLVRASQKLLM